MNDLSCPGTNEPFSRLFICADADPMNGTHWVVYYWVAILVIESILLSLALYKAWLHRPSTTGSSLMRELTRHSVIYFFAYVIYCTPPKKPLAYGCSVSN